MGSTPQVSGYRPLTAEEVALIEEIKVKAAEIGALVERVQSAGLPIDGRAAAIAKTELQTGFIWLVRSVAKPESF